MRGAGIDFADLQGILRFGHGRLRSARFILLQVTDAAAAGRWLSTAPVTSAAAVSPLPDTALQLAFTAPGLAALGLTAEVLAGFSAEFLGGITGTSRSRRLGDVGANDPHQWAWGGSASDTPHALLMLYALEDQLESWQQQLMAGDFTSAFTVLATLDANTTVDREPFGFADGISQPNIDWYQRQSTELHRRGRYSNLLALGEIVLGYPNEYGEYTARPLVAGDNDPAAGRLPRALDNPLVRDLGRNGSYLVLRQLAQDVPGFWRFIDAQAELEPQRREQLAAKLVGRSREGKPLNKTHASLIPGISAADSDRNNFNFDNDLLGHRCPIGAHVRRSNPRTGDMPPGASDCFSRLRRILGFTGKGSDDDLVASTRFHRLLRRGRPYGAELTPEDALRGPDQQERGLHFVCLAGNIARQFEFIQNAWLVNPAFAGLVAEGDPLVGNREPLADRRANDSLSWPTEDGPRESITGMPQFVKVRGGSYFFLPGIRALAYLAAVAGESSSSGSRTMNAAVADSAATDTGANETDASEGQRA